MDLAEELDGWMRRCLRVVLRREWKCGRTRFKRLVARGLSGERDRASACNGCGSWWNSGASHMNDAFRKKSFDDPGLVNLLETLLGNRTA